MLNQRLMTLSDLKIIGPKRLNPHAAEAERIAEAYCRDLGIWLPNFQEYTTMPGYLHPDADRECLITIIMIDNFLYYIDDLFTSSRSNPDEEDDVEMQKIYRNFIPILKYGQMPEEEHMLYTSCKFIRDRVIKLAPEAWLQRVTDSLVRHLTTSTLSVQAIMVNGVPDIDRYIHLREYDSGMEPTLELLEMEMDAYLPVEVKAHPTIHELSVNTMRIGSLMNDLFSYYKEVIVNGQRFNLVQVLMESRKLSFDEAVHESILMLNNFTDTFLELEQQLPDFGDEDINHRVRLYVKGMRNAIIATYHWQMETNRYRSPDSPFPELRVLL